MADRSAPVIYVSIVQQGHAAKARLDVSDSVLSLKYEDKEHEAAKLTLSVDNFDLANFDLPIWRKGTLLEASWGYVGNTVPTYSAVIQSVKGFQVLQIEAIAKSILMHKEAKTRKWVNVKRSDVARLVAAENGYGAAAAQIQDSKVVMSVVHQARETDAQLLARLARAEGWLFHVDFDGLHFHERKLGQPPLREFVWYGDPAQGDIVGYPSIENDVTAKPASVTIKGRDPLAKSDYSVTADNDSTKRDGLADAIEIVDPVTGQATFQLGTGQATVAPSSELTAATAQRKADGIFKNAQITTVLMNLPIIGDPLVRAKSVVTVKGMRSLSGNYYVASATDDVSTAGFKQTLSLRRDGRSEIFPKAAKSAAKQNAQAAKEDDGTLEPLERVNPVTGQTETVFVDSRGRQQGG
jgi:uncharacterized protein